MTCWFYLKVKKSRNDRHDIRFIIKFKYRLSCRRYWWAYLGHGCDSRRLHQLKITTLILFVSKFFSLLGVKTAFLDYFLCYFSVSVAFLKFGCVSKLLLWLWSRQQNKTNGEIWNTVNLFRHLFRQIVDLFRQFLER